MPKVSLPSGYKLCMTWISHYTPQNKGWSLEKIESESSSSYDNFLDGLPDKEIQRQSEKQSIDNSLKTLPKNSTEKDSDQINLLVTEEQCNETLQRDETSLVLTNKDRERLKSSHYEVQLGHMASVKQEGSQDLSAANGLFGGWKTSSGKITLEIKRPVDVNTYYLSLKNNVFSFLSIMFLLPLINITKKRNKTVLFCTLPTSLP